jgi:CHASE2 domain-containing sensor protein
MQRFLITAANCALLALLLIGLPAATHARLGDLQISSVSASRQLLFGGLAVAAAGNILAALFLFKGRKERKLCRWWAAIFSALLLAHWLFIRGWIGFRWLQSVLLWVQKHF